MILSLFQHQKKAIVYEHRITLFPYKKGSIAKSLFEHNRGLTPTQMNIIFITPE